MSFFDDLSSAARDHGHDLEVHVNSGKPLGQPGKEYRVATSLRVTPRDKPETVTASEPCKGLEDRERASRVLSTRLGWSS